MSEIRTIVFDLDNTLIDRDSANLKSLETWAIKNNLNDSWVEEARIIDDGGHGDRAHFFDFLATHSKPQICVDEARERYRSLLVDRITPFPETYEVISKVRARFQTGILSNGDSHHQRAKIKKADLADSFLPSEIIVSSEIGHRKPHHRAFREVETLFNAIPSSLIYVGDSYEVDFLGALNAGWTSILIDRTRFNQISEFRDGYIINDLQALEKLFEA